MENCVVVGTLGLGGWFHFQFSEARTTPVASNSENVIASFCIYGVILRTIIRVFQSYFHS